MTNQSELDRWLDEIGIVWGGVVPTSEELRAQIKHYITADRKRVALEARLNEVQNAYEHWINGRKFISSYFRDRIALLSDTKGSKNE